MREKYNNKYRIDSARKPGWDYTEPASYFITICTKDHVNFFGECKNGKMKLNAAGAIVQGFWYEIPKHFPHVELGEFITMPNHVHGVLTIPLPKTPEQDATATAERILQQRDEVINGKADPDFYSKIAPKKGSISIIIGSYKDVCKRTINKVFPDLNFAWQPRFHDRIIRSEGEYKKISNYIVNNPALWEQDKFYR